MVQPKTRYLVDEKGHKTAVVVSLKHYRQLLEDMQDLAVMAERTGEPAEPLEVVVKRLEKKWANTKSK